jgi:hypothetical protein
VKILATVTKQVRFFVGFALGLVPAVVFAVLGLLFLRHTYETARYDTIVADQLNLSLRAA